MKARQTGSLWINWVKALLTVALLAIVAYRVPLHELARRLQHLSFANLAVLSALTTAQVALSVVRWHRLLARVGERVSFLALFGDALVGLTYNMFLPSTVGGDVIRAVRARRRCAIGHHAWSTSLFERIAGLLAMATWGAIAAVVGASSALAIPPPVRWAALAMTVVLLFAFFAAAAPFRWAIARLERRMSATSTIEGEGAGPRTGVLITDVQGIASDLEGPLADPAARLEALGWSVLVQAVGVVFVLVGAASLGAPGHSTAIVVGVPIVHVLSTIPITLGGLGLRESLFVAILQPLGVAPDVALGLAAQWLASSFAFSLVGGAVMLLGRTNTGR